MSLPDNAATTSVLYARVPSAVMDALRAYARQHTMSQSAAANHLLTYGLGLARATEPHDLLDDYRPGSDWQTDEARLLDQILHILRRGVIPCPCSISS